MILSVALVRTTSLVVADHGIIATFKRSSCITRKLVARMKR